MIGAVLQQTCVQRSAWAASFVVLPPCQQMKGVAPPRAAAATSTPAAAKRFLTNESALRILGLSNSTGSAERESRPTMQQVRKAYLKAAKLCHPDVAVIAPRVSSTRDCSNKYQKDDDDEEEEKERKELAKKFHLVTEAFEFLERKLDPRNSSSEKKHGKFQEEEQDGSYFNNNHEQAYRQACWDVLNLPAEIVEESKQNPAFLEWLQGKTDAAHTWRDFLRQHGGLAPMLPRQGNQAALPTGGLGRRPQRRRR